MASYSIFTKYTSNELNRSRNYKTLDAIEERLKQKVFLRRENNLILFDYQGNIRDFRQTINGELKGLFTTEVLNRLGIEELPTIYLAPNSQN